MALSCSSKMKMNSMRVLALVAALLCVTSDLSAATNEFRKVVLAKGLNDPMELSVAPDGRVFFIERSGTLKIWKPDTQTTVVAAKIPVTFNYNIGSEAARTSKAGGWEDGLIGIALDPDFAKSHA